MDNGYYLQRYLNSDEVISLLYRRREWIQSRLYQQTLATQLVYDLDGIHVYAPKIQGMIADNIEACSVLDRRIERWKVRQRYFIKYLNELPSNERESLESGTYTRELAEKTQDEIQEIEIAIAFMFEQDAGVELAGDVMEDILILSEVF